MILTLFLGCFPSADNRNFPPTLELLSPEQDSVFNEGEMVQLELMVFDELLLSGGVTIQWISDIDGLLHEQIPNADGTVTLSNGSFSAGEHNTSIIAEDAEGLSIQQPLHLFINAAPNAPQVQILPENPDATDDLTVGGPGDALAVGAV